MGHALGRNKPQARKEAGKAGLGSIAWLRRKFRLEVRRSKSWIQTAEALGPWETQETEGNGALQGWTPLQEAAACLGGWKEVILRDGCEELSENFSVCPRVTGGDAGASTSPLGTSLRRAG